MLLPTTKSSLIRGELTVPLWSTHWKNKVQVLKALGEKRLPRPIMREKPNCSMLTHQRAHTNLPEAYFLTVPHLLEVPEERLVTFLTGVTIQPLGGLQHTHTHRHKVGASNKQQSFQWSLETGRERRIGVRQCGQRNLIKNPHFHKMLFGLFPVVSLAQR